ncbi:MAG: c-type cytochrome [Candidatus Eisenbacteria bacterium]|nr:c-type cytochrome [Candidatus Eisenbacteria bacterium]
MEVLSWIASLAGVLSIVLFTYWVSRADRLKAKSLRNAFVIGFAFFSVFFVVFTIQTLSVIPKRTNAELMTPLVDSGKKAWHKYVCIDCHTLIGNGAYYAPDLTKAWDRFVGQAGGDKDAEDAMIGFLEDPPQATSHTRGMPNLHMSDDEAKSLAEFLKWIAGIDTNGWPPKPSKPIVALDPAG